ncbi:MAG: lipid A biosynthesis lauroyl acyltransferase, partial [Gammaproteobacteria bacterium]|nr:lipid A biosynthesis lauroyl acyltransferase [Gammaproteobacteria bacterium]
MSAGRIPLHRFWQPRYWPTWLGVALLRLIVMLPHGTRLAVGRWLGRSMRRLLAKRREVAATNLALCFPQLSDSEREALEIRHFESLGMGVIELGITWWCPQDYIARIASLEGMEHVRAALDRGNGILMWSGHFATAELTGRMLEPEVPPIAAMYRPSENRLNDQIMRRCRGKSVSELITKSSVRTLIKALKANRPVWYAADQAYIGKGAVMAPFFSEPAMTNTAVSQIARVSKAAVVPFLPLRHGNGERYTLEFLPALEDFPG